MTGCAETLEIIEKIEDFIKEYSHTDFFKYTDFPGHNRRVFPVLRDYICDPHPNIEMHQRVLFVFLGQLSTDIKKMMDDIDERAADLGMDDRPWSSETYCHILSEVGEIQDMIKYVRHTVLSETNSLKP